MPSSSTLTLPLPPRFDLARAVCSYGYFLLAPNRWDPKAQRLHRPLRGESGRVIHTTISQPPRRARAKPGPESARGRVPSRPPPPASRLIVACVPAITTAERRLIARQITRMLRLDADPALLRAWRRLYPAAARARFDRTFRSPTLFEDMVKTITGCNVTWTSTMRMNRLLCEKVGPPEARGAFPTPGELAARSPAWLKRHCKVGYRAERIVRLARDVASGRLDLDPFEDARRPTPEVFAAIKRVHGFGDYAAGNLCQLLGRYDRLAIDTETYRHFEQTHGLSRGDDPKRLHPRIERHYARYAPYQFLAYWFDLWRGYQARFGPAWKWDAELHGTQFTASRLK